MEKKEFAIFAMALKTYYPKDNLLPNSQAMELWFKHLQDIPFRIAEAALDKWVATNKWPPTIADIREMTVSVQHGEKPQWSDGWDKVLRAIRKYGSYNVPAAMESLDPITRQCVERLGFKELCMSVNITADRANFRMIFEQLADRQQKSQQIPISLNNLIADFQRKGIEADERKRLPAADQQD